MTGIRDGFSAKTYEPVASTFYGYRAFLIDDSLSMPPARDFVGGKTPQKQRGTLRGVYQAGYRWGPGVNQATCLRDPLYSMTYSMTTVGVPPKHEQPIEECMCGFWAYTNGVHSLTVSGPAVFGIIEGWGRMVIGPHGFRAEKARIVALCFPKMSDSLIEDDAAASVAVVSPLAQLGRVVAQYGYSLSLAFHTIASALARSQGKAIPPAPQQPAALAAPVTPMNTPLRPVTRDLEAVVRRLYPVPVFDSIAEMQAAYPLTDLSSLLAEEPDEGGHVTIDPGEDET